MCGAWYAEGVPLPIRLALSTLMVLATTVASCASEGPRAPGCETCGVNEGGGRGPITGGPGSGGSAGAAGSGGASGAPLSACNPFGVTILEKNDVLLESTINHTGVVSVRAIMAGGGMGDTQIQGGAGTLGPVSCTPQWLLVTPFETTIVGSLARDDMTDTSAALFVVRRDLLQQIAVAFGGGISDGAGHVLASVSLSDGGTDEITVTAPGASMALYHSGPSAWSKVPAVAKAGMVLLTNVQAGDAGVVFTRKGHDPVVQTVPVLPAHVTVLSQVL